MSSIDDFFEQKMELDCYYPSRNYPAFHIRRSERLPQKLYLTRKDNKGQSLITYIMYRTLHSKDQLNYHGQAHHQSWLTMTMCIHKNTQVIEKLGRCDLEVHLQPRVDDTLDLLSSHLYVPIKVSANPEN